MRLAYIPRVLLNVRAPPRQQLHFRTDAPIELKSLFFFPSYHTEKFGMARLEPGVSLYSRKVTRQCCLFVLLLSKTIFVDGR